MSAAPVADAGVRRRCHAVFEHSCLIRGRHSAAAQPGKIPQNCPTCALHFAHCGMGGRWHAWALHACSCMCARAVEMPFSITFSAAVGVAERLRGWDVAQKLARLALSNVAERGIDSRGHALAVGPLQGALISAHLV